MHLTGVNNSAADSTSDNMVSPASEIDTNVNRDTVITVEVVKKQHSRDTIIDVRTDGNNGVTVVESRSDNNVKPASVDDTDVSSYTVTAVELVQKLEHPDKKKNNNRSIQLS